MAPLLLQAIGCFWSGCEFDDCICGCKRKSQVLCCIREIACAPGEECTGCGMVTNPNNNECCKIGCLLCACGCKEPDTCCKGACQMCCIKEVIALPLDNEYLDTPVCAYDCLSCYPNCGCCVEAPRCVALERSVFDYSPVPHEKMDREGIQMASYSDDVVPMADVKKIDTYKDEY